MTEKSCYKIINCALILMCFAVISGCVSTDLVKQMVEDIDTLRVENRELRQEVTDLTQRIDDLEVNTGSEQSEPANSTINDDMAAVLANTEAPDFDDDPIIRRPEATSGEELYATGQGLYGKQRYREAAQAFIQAAILDDSPEFKARCHYWTGESMYAQGAYDRALESFANVFVKYGSTSKAADALLKIGFTYYEMQNYNGARQALDEFIKRFPDHRAVPFAEERIRQIENQESSDTSSE